MVCAQFLGDCLDNMHESSSNTNNTGIVAIVANTIG